MESENALGLAPFPADIAQRIRAANPKGVMVFGFNAVSSTMDLSSAVAAGELSEASLSRFALSGNAAVKVFVALSQSMGRGRKQRAWISQPGRGIYATFLFHTARESAELGGLSLTMGLAVQDACHELGADVFLKWPNDVLASVGSKTSRRKLAGILVDVSSSKLFPQQRAVHVGVGVNLREQEFPPGVSGVSLEEVAEKELAYEAVFSCLSDAILRRGGQFWSSGFAPLADEWNHRSGQLGEEAEVELPGGQTKRGRVIGVDSTGGLRICDVRSGEESTVYSGELR